MQPAAAEKCRSADVINAVRQSDRRHADAESESLLPDGRNGLRQGQLRKSRAFGEGKEPHGLQALRKVDPAQAGVEIDVMESFAPGDVVDHWCHYNGYGIDHRHQRAGEGAKGLSLDGYHLFGVEWNDEGYTFYIDGRADGHVPGPVSQCPEFILIGTEVQGYRNAGHAPMQHDDGKQI